VTNLLKLLAILTALGPKIPKAIELIMAFIALFAPDAESASDGLQLAEMTPAETALVGVISEAMTADGTQAVIDFSRLRRFAKWASESAAGKMAFDALIAILLKAITGG
jgi:hypothetical protein